MYGTYVAQNSGFATTREVYDGFLDDVEWLPEKIVGGLTLHPSPLRQNRFYIIDGHVHFGEIPFLLR